MQSIQPQKDEGSVQQGVGGIAVSNVISNDYLLGVTGPAIGNGSGQVTLTQTSSSHAGVVLNTTTGEVTVTSAVPAGVYTLVYEICEAGASPANCNSAVVTINVIIDSDNDGISDANDIDDDNDGILDINEGIDSCAGTITSPIRQLPNDGPITDTNNVDLTSLGVSIGDNVTISNLLADGDLTTASEVFSLTINSGTPITNLQTGDDCNGSLIAVTSPISEIVTVIDIGGGTPGVELVVSYPADVNFCDNRVEYTVDITCTPQAARDTDLDGIPDYQDLDSDNDGIPDIIEAQSTIGYITPLGVDSDNDGLDDAYDTTPNGNSNGFGSIGLTPINTDGTDNADYLDLDSDNDGTNDIIESGSGLANDGSEVTGAVGSNGLINTLDNGDDYTDPNGNFDNTQNNNFTDTDSDVNSGGDVDYRDIPGDSDNDGIPDSTRFRCR